MAAASYTAELHGEPGVAIGRERVVVRFADGRTEEFRLHDYDRLYAIPGLYERIVQERLRCQSPAVLAGLLAEAVDGCGLDRSAMRVIDIAAGNGVSGEALAAAGLRPVLGTDLEPGARAAALRDRPRVYDEYLTLDLLALTPQEQAHLRGLRANAVSCVAPVRDHQVPVAALAAAVQLLDGGDGLVVYMHEPGLGLPDGVTAAALGGGGARELHRRRYRHRDMIDGRPFEMDGVVWRIGPAGPGQAQ